MNTDLKRRVTALESAQVNPDALPVVGIQEPGETEATALARLEKENPDRRVILLAQFVGECV